MSKRLVRRITKYSMEALLRGPYPTECIVEMVQPGVGVVWIGHRINGAWIAGADPRLGWPVPLSMLEEDSTYGFEVLAGTYDPDSDAGGISRDVNGNLTLRVSDTIGAESAIALRFLETDELPPCMVWVDLEIAATSEDFAGGTLAYENSRFEMQIFADGETTSYVSMALDVSSAGQWRADVIKFVSPTYSKANGSALAVADWKGLYGGSFPLQFGTIYVPQFYGSAFNERDSYENRGSGVAMTSTGWDWNSDPDQGVGQVVLTAKQGDVGGDDFTVTVKGVRVVPMWTFGSGR